MSASLQNHSIIPKFIFVIPRYNSHTQLPKLVNSLIDKNILFGGH